ncbi:MAG: SRPBCC family protein [Erythrobacter sp.]|nr:MAG: SRPBCC family protein [Erythrobacter sp.]
MNQHRSSTVGIAVGLGLTAGGVLLASLARRHKGGRDSAPGYTARRIPGKFDVTGKTVTIRKPRAELFAYWRDFANLPAIMENLEHVEVMDNQTGHSAWSIKAPAGNTVRIETKIAREVADELIAWRSVEGSEIATEGRVMFSDAPGDRGTQVTLIIAYQPPAGAVGKAVAKLFIREPAVQARHDLKRFKMLMETGEIATSANRKDETRAAQQEKKS